MIAGCGERETGYRLSRYLEIDILVIYDQVPAGDQGGRLEVRLLRFPLWHEKFWRAAMRAGNRSDEAGALL